VVPQASQEVRHQLSHHQHDRRSSVLTIVASRGNVYLLASLYAFGVIWSFSFNGLSTTVLRFTERQKREFKVPGNFRVGDVEVPYGMMLITLVLFAVALVNLLTKPLATIAGITFSLVMLAVFTVSERITHKQREGRTHMVEQFRVSEQPLVEREEMAVRPGQHPGSHPRPAQSLLP
jgi:hypothetical protein